MVIDFDGYFAGVEQHLNPALRGKPIGVVPMLTDSTCCIASNYLAKAHGVKTGTNVGQARAMCPGIQIVEAKHERYVRCHHLAIEALESCLAIEKVMSIDEACCVLPKNYRERGQALEMAQRVKRAMRRKLSEWITCSVGIAPNAWLAKVASKVNKPDGVTIWEDGKDFPESLFQMDLGDLHGVGKRMEDRIRGYGISSVRQLYALDRSCLHRIWGSVEGSRLWSHLHGEVVPVIDSERRSVGHSHVMAPDERAPMKTLAVLQGLTLKAGRRSWVWINL